jgi:hypothetical protein
MIKSIFLILQLFIVGNLCQDHIVRGFVDFPSQEFVEMIDFSKIEVHLLDEK